MATNTPTYSFLKPTVGGDTSVWGGYLNTNFDDIDGLLDGTSPVTGIDINGGSIDGTPIGAAAASTGTFTALVGTTVDGAVGSVTPAAGTFTVLTSNGIDDNATSTSMTLDAAGNVLVGTTSTGFSAEGHVFRAGDYVSHTVDNDVVALFNRTTSDGQLLQFRKDGVTVGSIGTKGGDAYIASTTQGIRMYDANNTLLPTDAVGAGIDATISLGQSGSSFKDLYLSGGVYLGGTGAANKLDDYEEGTWTPILQFGGNAVGMVYSVQAGFYTKVGRAVNASLFVVLNGKGSSVGNALLQGLPFVAAAGNGYSSASFRINDVSFADFPQGYAGSGATFIALEESTNGGARTSLTNANFAGTSQIMMQVTYITDL